MRRTNRESDGTIRRINWRGLDIDNEIEVAEFSALAEEAGKETMRRAIARHKRAGNPIYFADARGRIIKELADGRRFHVRLVRNGKKEILRELSVA